MAPTASQRARTRASSTVQKSTRWRKVSLGTTRYQWPSSMVIRDQPSSSAPLSNASVSSSGRWGRAERSGISCEPLMSSSAVLPTSAAEAGIQASRHRCRQTAA